VPHTAVPQASAPYKPSNASSDQIDLGETPYGASLSPNCHFSQWLRRPFAFNISAACGSWQQVGGPHLAKSGLALVWAATSTCPFRRHE
jgi:hypothetical protein